jgi:DDE domain
MQAAASAPFGRSPTTSLIGQPMRQTRRRSVRLRLKKEGTLRSRCHHRPVQYLNNIIEQDHRAIKRRVNAKQGFREFQAARRTIGCLLAEWTNQGSRDVRRKPGQRSRDQQSGPNCGRVWVLPTHPNRLELIPGTEMKAHKVEWATGDTFNLMAPILNFTIQEVLDSDFRLPAPNRGTISKSRGELIVRQSTAPPKESQ